MRAISIQKPGGPGELALVTLPTPEPGPAQVLIKVTAAGLNRADLLQRKGHYPPPPGASLLPGMEVSGIIEAVGPGQRDGDDWKPGSRVCALLPGGGYAEYAVADAGSCLLVPESVPLADAAGLPEAVFTVWANLFAQAPGQHTSARVVAGERLLVQGGTSGIGSMALQMAKARGVRAAATAGSAEKCMTCLHLGAEFAANYREDWREQIQGWAPGGVDCVLDMVAGPYFAEHLALLAKGGRLTHIATSQGSEVALDLRLVMQKRLTITGSTLRGRSPEEKRALRDEIEREVWPRVVSGQIHPVIHGRFPLEEAATAHATMELGGHSGKILLIL